MVIYESTVYPGATEERCVPVLESVSGLKFNEDFFVGYSPGTDQPRRQGASGFHDRQGHLRVDARGGQFRRRVARNLVVKVGTHRAPRSRSPRRPR